LNIISRQNVRVADRGLPRKQIWCKQPVGLRQLRPELLCFQHGNYFVGIVVFVFSILFPLTKIVLLLELSMLELFHRRHKAFTLRMMEQLGKWSMMDVMLLAFLVMAVKLGEMVEFHFGPAIVAFVLCVVMSMVASLCFDPHAIWDEAETS
jgi:paraquat-inducible protein A